MIELAFVVGGGIVALVIWLAVRRQKALDHVERVWRQHAKRFKARYVAPEHTALGQTPIRLVLRWDGRNLTAELEGGDQPKTSATVVRAKAPGSNGLELRVYREGVLSMLTRALGYPAVSTGDPALDGRVEIRANNPDLALAWLSDEVRWGIEKCEDYHFSVSRGEARAERIGPELSPFQLEKVLRTVTALAAGGEGLLRRAQVLAAELGGMFSARKDFWEPDGKVLTVVELQGVQILIDGVLRDRSGLKGTRVWTRVRARALSRPKHTFLIHGHRGLEPPEQLAGLPAIELSDRDFTRSFTVMGNDEAFLAELLSSPVRERIRRLAPALVQVDDAQVEVMLEGLVFDTGVVVAAIELAVDLAAPTPSGPYR